MGSNGLKKGTECWLQVFFVFFLLNGLLWVRMNGNGSATGCRLPMG